MRKGAARGIEASYDQGNNGGEKKIAPDEAIQKLFDQVLYEKETKQGESEETKIARDEPVKLNKYTNEPEYNQKVQDEHGRKNKQTENIPRFRVIRGKLA